MEFECLFVTNEAVYITVKYDYSKGKNPNLLRICYDGNLIQLREETEELEEELKELEADDDEEEELEEPDPLEEIVTVVSVTISSVLVELVFHEDGLNMAQKFPPRRVSSKAKMKTISYITATHHE